MRVKRRRRKKRCQRRVPKSTRKLLAKFVKAGNKTTKCYSAMSVTIKFFLSTNMARQKKGDTSASKSTRRSARLGSFYLISSSSSSSSPPFLLPFSLFPFSLFPFSLFPFSLFLSSLPFIPLLHSYILIIGSKGTEEQQDKKEKERQEEEGDEIEDESKKKKKKKKKPKKGAEEYKKTACQICKSRKQDNKMLLCDECDSM
eukprot:Phypoly_transcript_18588.p1 GENE.Phypoly_transcript_18588~~Phypoly_transcript_18588.p1  ORF type:complete len:201 (+),score=55.50 Phypoly_transcript_18588:105-707(+)